MLRFLLNGLGDVFLRYWLAIVSLAFAALLFILGVGQRTFLAPEHFTASLRVPADVPYAILSAQELSKEQGEPLLVASGDAVFVATGKQRDVAAWLEAFNHVEFTFDSKKRVFLGALVPPLQTDSEAVALRSPAGSDLWLNEITVARGERLPVELAFDEALLLAPAGVQGKLPGGARVQWFTELYTPFAGPLLVAGGLFFVVGGVLYLFAFDRELRGKNPTRGMRGPFKGVRAWMSSGRRVRAVAAAAKKDAGVSGRKKPVGGEVSEAEKSGVTNAGGAETGTSGVKESGVEKPASVAGERQKLNEGNSRENAATVKDGRKGFLALKNIRAVVLGVAFALTLSACTQSMWPGADPYGTGAVQGHGKENTETPGTAGKPGVSVKPGSAAEPQKNEGRDDVKNSTLISDIPPVPLADRQLERIVADISRVVASADESLTVAELEKRFTLDALQARQANYKIRAAQTDYPVRPPAITENRLGYELVESTDGWPRNAFIAVRGRSSTGEQVKQPSLLLQIEQKTPLENYMVKRVVTLRGGIEMPKASPAEEGTASLAGDAKTLLIAPDALGTAFATLLREGDTAAVRPNFDDSVKDILETNGIARTKKQEAEAKERGETMKFSLETGVQDTPPLALSTSADGALVTVTVFEKQIVDAAGGRYKPQAAGAVTALSGLSGEQAKIVQQVSHQLLFFVPNKSSGHRVQLLGSASELVAAAN